MSLPVVGEAQIFKKKPISVEAIQFTGKNAKAFAQWVRDRGFEAKAGGAYVDVIAPNDTQRVKKGMIMVSEREGHIHLYVDDAEFRAVHTISVKTNALM